MADLEAFARNLECYCVEYAEHNSKYDEYRKRIVHSHNNSSTTTY